jgi:hypothetical protein
VILKDLTLLFFNMKNYRQKLDVEDILEAAKEVYKDAPELYRVVEMMLL